MRAPRSKSMDLSYQGCDLKPQVVLRGTATVIPTIMEEPQRLGRLPMFSTSGANGQNSRRRASMDMAVCHNLSSNKSMNIKATLLRKNSDPTQHGFQSNLDPVESLRITDAQRDLFLKKVADHRTQIHKQVMECSPEQWKEMQQKLRQSNVRTNAGLAMAWDCALVDSAMAEKRRAPTIVSNAGRGAAGSVQSAPPCRLLDLNLDMGGSCHRFGMIGKNVLRELAATESNTEPLQGNKNALTFLKRLQLRPRNECNPSVASSVGSDERTYKTTPNSFEQEDLAGLRWIRRGRRERKPAANTSPKRILWNRANKHVPMAELEVNEKQSPTWMIQDSPRKRFFRAPVIFSRKNNEDSAHVKEITSEENTVDLLRTAETPTNDMSADKVEE